MFSLQLSAEQIEFRDTVRDFANDVIKPVTLKSDRLDLADRRLPMDVLDQASQMGLRALALSEDLGGVGADNLTCCLVVEELAVGDTDVAAVLAETALLGRVLFNAMSPAQREKFLQPFLSDDRYHLAHANHEPDADESLGVNYFRKDGSRHRVTAKATKDGSDWVINGVKDCVVNAPIAKLFAVEIATDQGVSTILVPAGTPGLTVTAQAEPRWHHGSCGQIALKDLRVPAGNLLGAEGQSPLEGRDVPLAQAANLGIGRAAYEAALDYAQLRVQGGRPIVQHQAIGTKLAEVAIRLETCRNMIWKAAWASDHPEAVADRSIADLPLTAMAAVFTAEQIYRAAKDSAECFGAMGVMRDMPLQKYISDARICLYSGDGAADAKLRIAEALGNHRRPTMLAAE
jgi:alkylation response protein AidB-like acyl-CoA dehydrogenase